MSEIVRSLGFTNSLQRLVWPKGLNIPVTAYLWGGGGGGGGSDRLAGGTGGGGGFTEFSFTVSEGDVIDIAIGGGGGRGATTPGVGSAPGGVPGPSYISNTAFDTRSAASSPPVIPSTNSAYVGFLNQYGIWVNPVSATNFDRSYTVNFPVTGLYTFTASCDNFGTIFLDGSPILDVPGFTTTYSTTVSVTAGTKTVRIVGVNTGGPGAVGLTITGGVAYSGGRGADAGPVPWSGGGGGGGGATVLLKNNQILAVAGGGGGAGGGGNFSSGENAPGFIDIVSGTAGQPGQPRGGDGGGSGGGGGGLNGGTGGFATVGDVGGLAGSYGISSTENPNGRIPGGVSNSFYLGSAAVGGNAGSSGNAGLASLKFNVVGLYASDGSLFRPVQNVFVRSNDQWNRVRSVWIKENNVWEQVDGFVVPSFVNVSGNFGAI
jgi:hypothetical protein